VWYFRHILEARNFAIITDHKPLVYAFQQKRDKCTPRQFNQLNFISQFTTDIRHNPGHDKMVADAVSQFEIITAPITHDALASAQDEDDELQTLLGSDTALQLAKLRISGTSVELCCDTSSGTPLHKVPAPLRRQVFEFLHSLSHPGIKASAKLVSQRMLWTAIKKDCRT
jgi:hypothetical protein